MYMLNTFKTSKTISYNIYKKEDKKGKGSQLMNNAKAVFFDGQTNSPWACNEYNWEEIEKAEKVLNLCKIKQGSKIIEPGCGTGRLTKIVAERCGSSGEILAFDISKKMVKKTEKRILKYNNNKVLCMAAEEYSFKPNYYDVVLCHQTYQHFEKTELATKILANAIKPNGYFIISQFTGIEIINNIYKQPHSPIKNDTMPNISTIEQYL